jgi:hypothetical protein
MAKAKKDTAAEEKKILEAAWDKNVVQNQSNVEPVPPDADSELDPENEEPTGEEEIAAEGEPGEEPEEPGDETEMEEEAEEEGEGTEEGAEGEGEDLEEEPEETPEGQPATVGTVIEYTANKKPMKLELETKLSKNDVAKLKDLASLTHGLDDRVRQARDSENSIKADFGKLHSEHQGLVDAVQLVVDLDAPIKPLLDAVRASADLRNAILHPDSGFQELLKRHGYEGKDLSTYDYNAQLQERTITQRENALFDDETTRLSQAAIEEISTKNKLTEPQILALKVEINGMAQKGLLSYRTDEQGRRLPPAKQVELVQPFYQAALGNLYAKGILKTPGQETAEKGQKKVETAREREARRLKEKHSHGSAPGGGNGRGGGPAETRVRQRKGESSEDFLRRALKEDPRMRQAAKSAGLT